MPHHSTAVAATENVRSRVPRWAIPLVLALAAGLLVPWAGAGVSEADASATELSYACAKKKNGQMRAVDSLSQCHKKEVRVTVKPGPVELCVQPGGSVRLASQVARCRPPAQRITVPPQSGTEYFCAAIPAGTLRYVSDPSQCTLDEEPYQVTPNDDAPTVESTTPADGATHVATNTNVDITFSEPVTAGNGAFSLTCDGNGVAAAVTGSPGATVTINPDANLPEGVDCDVTVFAGGITDVDTLDPPNAITSNYEFSFTTDAAPEVASTTPADGATGVDAEGNITVEFSEPVAVTAASFTLECGGSLFPGGFAVSGSGTSAVTINPTGPLDAGSSCTVTVIAANVSDADGGDPPDHLASNYAFTFTTVDAAPTVVSTSPTNGATDVDPDTNIVITFSEPISVPSAAAYSIECPVGNPQGFTVLNLTGTTVTIDPAGSLPLATTCTFTAFGSQVSDSDLADPPNTMVSNYTFSFTIASNDPPTDITLAPSSIDEGNAVGDVVGELDAVDPDAGDTFTYALVGGTGSDDNGAFTIDGDKLKADEVFDFETKSSYSIRVEATDSFGATFQRQLTVTIADVDEAPEAGADSYSGAVGNTLAALGTTGTGPHVVLTGDVLTANDDDPEGATVSAVAETVATTGGGSATINANGSFTYLPGVGDKNQTDSFTYQVTDGTNTSSATAEIGIGADLVWYVDGDYTGAVSDGRSATPLKSLTPVNGAGGAGDADASGDRIFVYAAAGSYGGGLALENNQRLTGEAFALGLRVGDQTLVPAGTTAPVITNAAGNGLDLAEGVRVEGVAVDGASADGIHGVGINSADVAFGVTVSDSGADGVDLSGGSTGTLFMGATVTSSTARSVVASGRTGGRTTFGGPISGPGIVVSSNTGAIVGFTNLLTISSGTQTAFSATGGGTVNAANIESTLTTTTGTALVVEDVAFGDSGVRFKSISSNGAVNGIRLKNTGTSVNGLSISGDGNTDRGGNSSGGTIANSTGAGVLLTNTANVRINNLTVTGTPNAPGIDGTGVAGFEFTNGTVTGSGSTSKASGDSNIAFNDDGAANVTGVVTVSNSVLSNAYRHGVDIRNGAGSITAFTVSNNSITSPTVAADTTGTGIVVQARGTATTAASIVGGTITGNSITNFPGGGGIVVSGGNVTGLSTPPVTLGNGVAPINITSNLVQGQSQAAPMAANSIAVSLNGRGEGYVNVKDNGTAAQPLRFVRLDGICVTSQGTAKLTSQVTGNVLSPQSHVGSANGIRAFTSGVPPWGVTAETGTTLNLQVNNNTISGTGGPGIELVAQSLATLNSTVLNNFVAAPSVAMRNGIRVAAGFEGTDSGVCVQVTGNVASGSTGLAAIAMDKDGTDLAIHDFGVAGLTPSPASSAQVIALVNSQNTTLGGVTAFGENFVSCSPVA